MVRRRSSSSGDRPSPTWASSRRCSCSAKSLIRFTSSWSSTDMVLLGGGLGRHFTGLLEQAGQPAVGQGPATGLAGGAVLQRLGRVGDLADDVTADGTGLARATVDAHGPGLVALQLLGRPARGPGRGLGQDGDEGGVHALDLVGAQLR